MKKKVLAWMLSVFMVLTMMPLPAFANENADVSDTNESGIATIAENPVTGLSGSGTEADPYLINSIDELKWFRDDVNSGNNYSGKFIKLDANIDLNSEEWDPIGYMGSTFKGTFDGGNHKISNLVITKELSNAAANNGVGLFGRTDDPAVIKNFTIENVGITGSLYVGAVVGYGYTGKSVENVTVEGDIKIDAWWYAGVIGGNGYMSLVANCHVIGNEGSYIKGNDGSYIGGIWGFRGEGNNTITNCSVENIDISGVDRVGGICGIAHYGNTIKNNAIKTSSVTATDPDAKTVGIIAGANQGGKEKDNPNSPSFVVNNSTDNVTAKVDETEVTTITGITINDDEPVTVCGTEVTYDASGLITGGNFDRKVPATAVADNSTIKVGDYEYTKTDDALVGPAAKIGDDLYNSLKEAITIAENGDTITLIDDCVENVTVEQKPNVKITIDGANKKITGAITVDGKSARYDTAGVTIKNVNFDATGISTDASINLGKKGDNNTRYTNHVTVEKCTFTGGNREKVAIKSYTGGDKNLQVIGCTVDNTMHSLLQVTNVEEGLLIDGCTVNSKNGINLNSSEGVVIKNSKINVNGYAVRAGVDNGTSGAITLTDNTLATDNSEGDAVVVIRATAAEQIDLTMSGNIVSGDTHISGTTADTKVSADANYWDGEKAPVVSGTPVKVNSYYTDESKGNLVKIKWVAQVDGTKFDSLADAFAAAEDGDTVTLLEDVAVTNETYTIADGKSIKLDMNSKKITARDETASNVCYELFYIYGGLEVVGNGTIELTSTSNDTEWAKSSTIFHNRGGVLKIENGTYKHLGGTCMSFVIDNSGNWYGDATTTIKGGAFDSAYIAIRNRMEQNSHGASGKAILNVEDGIISGVSRAIWAQAASKSEASPATGEINVSGGEIGLIDTPRSSGAVSMTTISGGEVAAFKGETGELTVNGGAVGEVTLLTAAGETVDYAVTEDGKYVTAVAQIGETNYATLQDAIAAAEDSDTVKIIADIELDKPLTIAKDDKVTLDLNGKTINYDSTVQGEAMITNKGELIINDSSDEKTGVINYNYVGEADPSYGKGNYTISNAGTLTVNGGKITIANLSSHAKYPIDNNSTTGDAVLVINGGHLYNYNTSAIRQFCNSTTYKNSVTINGGLIEGYCAVWVQNPGSKTVNGDLTITDGEIKSTAKAYVNGTSELKAVGSRIYFTTEGGAWSESSSVSITGGTFNENVRLATDAPVKISVAGGEFNGDVSFENENSGIISGGTFIIDVSVYLAKGYALEINKDDEKGIIYGAITEEAAAKLEYSYTVAETGVTYYSNSKEALAEALDINAGNVGVNALYLEQQIADLQEALKAAESSNAASKEALEKQIADLQAALEEEKSLNAADKKSLEEKLAELEAEIAELSKEKQLATPTGVKASNVASTGKIKVTWTAVEGADEYAVYRSTSKDGSYKKMYTTTGTSYTNTSAKAGTTYYYKVKALSDDKKVNNSELSAAVKRTCDLARPTLTASNVASTGKVKITWKKVSGAEKYKVYRSTSKSGKYTLMKTVSGTSYINTSAKASTAYYYKVVAVDTDNTAANSAYSAVVKRTCDLARPAVTAKSTVKKQVKLTWKKVTGAKNYVVYRATSKNGKYTKIATTTKVSYTNKSLKTGKTYYYKVRAIAKNSAANSAYSTVDKCKAK